MKSKVFILISFILLFSCDLDSNLFNTKKIVSYELPGNTIQSTSYERVTFYSEGYKFRYHSKLLDQDLKS